MACTSAGPANGSNRGLDGCPQSTPVECSPGLDRWRLASAWSPSTASIRRWSRGHQSSLSCFVLAAGIYAISLRWAKRDWFRIERGLDPADEVDDPWEARIKCTSCEKSYTAIEMDRADASVGGAPYCSLCAERRQSSDA